MNSNDTYNKLHDKNVRKELIANPQAAGDLLGFKSIEGIEFSVKVNTKDTTYVVMPKDIDSLNLDAIRAAGVTAGSISCLGSIGTACSTASSAGTTGTIDPTSW